MVTGKLSRSNTDIQNAISLFVEAKLSVSKEAFDVLSQSDDPVYVAKTVLEKIERMRHKPNIVSRELVDTVIVRKEKRGRKLNDKAKAYMTNGKHLLLMKYLWNIQIEAINKGVEHITTKEYLDFLANELMKLGFGRAHRGVKRNLQAMISLWGGGFNLLKRKGNKYYFPKFGLVFDWGKITSILQREYW